MASDGRARFDGAFGEFAGHGLRHSRSLGAALIKADLHASGVGFQAFGSGQGGDGGGQFAEGGLGQFLDGDHFQVVGDGEAAALPGGAAGGEDVIGAGGVIAGGFGTVGADEDAAGVPDCRRAARRREC